MEMENTALEEENTSDVRYWQDLKERCWEFIQRNAFLASCTVAVSLGIALGLILKIIVHFSEHDQLYIGFPGEILMRMLQVVSIPLIVTSVTIGVSGLGVETSKKVAFRAVAYFISTTLLSVIIGLILVLLIKPGVNFGITKEVTEDEELFSTLDTLLDLVRNMAPENLIQACFQQYQTDRVVFEIDAEQNSSLETIATEMRLVGQYVEGTNTVGLIVWSFIFGLVINRIGEKGKVLVDALTALNETTKCAVNLILCYLPFGVLFMITSHVVEVHDWETTFKLGKFMIVVLLGLIIHGGLVLPMIYFFFTKSDPRIVIKGVSPALATALVISSSSATLPHTLDCCENKLKLDKRVIRFVLPIGTNINMDGSALYEVVAAVFIGQLNNIHLDLSQLITVAVTAAVTSIGAAGIPATGAVTTLIVLTSVGLPAKEVSILLVVEWLLDRCNTVINVLGDCFGAALVNQLLRTELEAIEVQGQERTRREGRDAEGHTLDEIQVQISSQASGNDSRSTQPQKPSAQDSETRKQAEDKDQHNEILLSPPDEEFVLAHS